MHTYIHTYSYNQNVRQTTSKHLCGQSAQAALSYHTEGSELTNNPTLYQQFHEAKKVSVILETYKNGDTTPITSHTVINVPSP